MLETAYVDTLMPRRGRFPYYIVAPRYVRTSAGVRALHLLCHWLNMTGQSAFVLVYPEWDGLQINPELQTPLLTEAIVAHHMGAGQTPIVLYPEVITDNPLNAPVIVRFVANYPGLLGGAVSYPVGDILFAYSEHLARTINAPHNVLSVPVLDTLVFKPTPVVSRSGTCFYAAKFQEVHGGTVFGVPPGSIEITRDDPDLTPQALADLFRGSELFYCFEDSALINEAALCGCPVVMMKSDFFQWPLAIDEVGWDGYAWGDEPAEVERARRTVDKAYDNYVRNVPRFYSQLHYFVLVTQRRASATPYVDPVRLTRRRSPGPNATGYWRRRLGDALLELADQHDGTARPTTVWVPALSGADALGAVCLVSGWSDPDEPEVRMVGPTAVLAVLPPRAAAVVAIEVEGDPRQADRRAFQLRQDGDLLSSVGLAPGQHHILRVPVIESNKPMILSFHSAGEDARPLDLRLKRVAVIDGERDSFETSERKRDAAGGPSPGQASRYLLSTPSRVPLSPANCTAAYDRHGLLVQSSRSDPHVVLVLDKRVLAAGKGIFLWGVVERDSDDVLQVYLPASSAGDFTEAVSARTALKAGVNAFSMTLPDAEDLTVIRLDPGDRAGTTRFRHLELVVAGGEGGEADRRAATQPTSPFLVPNLERFEHHSLMDGLAVPLAKGCVVEYRQRQLWVVPRAGQAEVVFAIPVPSEFSSGRIHLSGEYDCDLDGRLEVTLPGSSGTSTSDARTGTVDIRKGRHRFLVDLGPAWPVHLVEMRLSAHLGPLRFSNIAVLIGKFDEPPPTSSEP